MVGSIEIRCHCQETRENSSAAKCLFLELSVAHHYRQEVKKTQAGEGECRHLKVSRVMAVHPRYRRAVESLVRRIVCLDGFVDTIHFLNLLTIVLSH